MNIFQINQTVAQINLDWPKYNLQPSYQRGAVWSRDDQQYLIDSILRRYDLPKIYISKPGEKASEDIPFDVIDGQQRLTSIIKFVQGNLELGDNSKDINGIDLSGLTYSNLPELYRTIVSGYTLTTVFVEGASRDEIRDMFLRLQEGKSLNPAEKRNAVDCAIGSAVKELVLHKLMVRKVRSKDSRFSHQDWIAHLACVLESNSAVDLNAAALWKFYERSKSNSLHKTALIIKTELNSIMSKMSKCFVDDSVPELDIKWGFIDLAYLIKTLSHGYYITNRYEDIGNFYKDFELERRSVRDPLDFLAPGYSGKFPGKEMFEYREKFVRDGHRSDSIAIRHGVYLRCFLQKNQNLMPKDPVRAFNKDERIIIYRKAKGKCQMLSCKKGISFDEFEADHVTPHSRGGKTTLDNAQCLCVDCNRSKSASN
tara:strand:+ start:2059 stop:3336 length:1278 start_codon:yes stop_codon:yes gene_type:complete